MGLGPLLPSQAFILGSQELDVKQGPFPGGLKSPALAGRFFTTDSPGKPIIMITIVIINVSQYVLNLYVHISYIYLFITF